MRTFAIGLLLIIFANGCGRNDLAQVKGIVTYRGKPLSHGQVGFSVADHRPAIGVIAADGTFNMMTLKPEDGARIGKNLVTVVCNRPTNPSDAFSGRVTLIPLRYQSPDTSGLTAEVKPGENEFRFELQD